MFKNVNLIQRCEEFVTLKLERSTAGPPGAPATRWKQLLQIAGYEVSGAVMNNSNDHACVLGHGSEKRSE